VLCKVLAIGGSEADNSSSARVNHIDSDHHCILHSGCNLYPIQVFFKLGVDLLEDIGVNGDFSTVNR